jgi:hypothetical protein
MKQDLPRRAPPRVRERGTRGRKSQPFQKVRTGTTGKKPDAKKHRENQWPENAIEKKEDSIITERG